MTGRYRIRNFAPARACALALTRSPQTRFAENLARLAPARFSRCWARDGELKARTAREVPHRKALRRYSLGVVRISPDATLTRHRREHLVDLLVQVYRGIHPLPSFRPGLVFQLGVPAAEHFCKVVIGEKDHQLPCLPHSGLRR